MAAIERRELARALGDGARAEYDERPLDARVTLRHLRLAMSEMHVCADLWGEVRGVLWAGANQAGLVVRDAGRFHELAARAARADGSSVFRADPRWLLRLFKHKAEWSLRETGAREWGLQLYRRAAAARRSENEIVADVDRATLESGMIGHVFDVLRPGSDPRAGWERLVARSGDEWRTDGEES